MIFATWNVNSISARLEHVREFLSSYEPDILCMQETKIVDDKFPRDLFLDRGYELEIYGEKSYNGVAIASKLPLSGVHRGFKKEVGPGSCRLIGATTGDWNILNVYIPNGQYVGSDKYHYKLEWMSALKTHIEDTYDPDEPLIICGDFNIAPEDRDVYNAKEYDGAIMCSHEERDYMQRIKDFGFIDIFREQHDEAGLFTWWDYQAGAFRRNRGFRIDHIWATAPAAEKCAGTMIAREMREMTRPSDHAPVIAEFEIE